MKRIVNNDPEIQQACGICTETFNQSSRTQVVCPFCNYTTCRQCASTYILDLITPCCMSCKRGWNTTFIYGNFSKSWIEKDYKTTRKNHLFDHEISKIPLTLEKIAFKKELEEQLSDLLSEQAKIHTQVEELRTRIYRVNYKNDDPINNSKSSDSKKEIKKFIMPCPVSDCRGYLSSAYKCGVCNINVCKDCLLIKKDSETHECKEEDIQTVKEIRSSTKPCPKCGTRIQKISGCDQMFCTSCNTAFGWTSGKILVGNIHNPHYFEYINRRGTGAGNPLDFQCGGIVRYEQINRWFEQQKAPYMLYKFRNIELPVEIKIGQCVAKNFNTLTMFINSIVRMAGEIRDYRLREIHRPNNTELRIKWINKQIEKNNYLITLARREKEYNFTIEEQQLYRMISDVMNDFLNNILVLNINIPEFQQQVNILVEMIEYFNTQMRWTIKHFGYTRSNCFRVSTNGSLEYCE